jgi:flagellin
MVTGASYSVSYNSIATFNKKNENSLASSLLKLASGKRFNQPSDNIPDYFVASRLEQNNSTNEKIKVNLAQVSTQAGVAEQAGTYIFDDLTTAYSLVEEFYDPSTPSNEKDAIKTQFSMLMTQITSTIDNTFWDGQQVIRDTGTSSFASVAIDASNPDEMLTLSFSGNQIADVSSLVLGNTDFNTESQAVQVELNKAASYLSRVSVFNRSLNAFYNITEAAIAANQHSLSGVSDINTGEEMMRAMDKSIRHQSSLAMMAQANMIQGSILQLFR